MAINCPVCNNSDLVQKVPVLASSDTISGSKLILTLPSLPSDPNDTTNYGCAFGALLWLILGTLAIFGGFFALGQRNQGGGGEGILFVGIGIGMIVIWWRTARSNGEAKDKEREAYKVAVLNRDRQMAIWNELYYCERDDCVFHPSYGSSARSFDMLEYINGVLRV